MQKLILSIVLLLLSLPLGGHAVTLIEQVETTTNGLDLSQKEEFQVSWNQSTSAVVTVHICDLEGNIVNTLLDKKEIQAGPQELTWDGTNSKKHPCPEGVYFPVIKAKVKNLKVDRFNPTSREWGQEVTAKAVSYDQESQLVQYTLDEQAMVRIRVGEKGGSMYKTILNWQVREKGIHQEDWDGMDASGIIDVTAQKNVEIFVDAFTLPQQSVVLTGSHFKKGRGNSPKYKQYPVTPPNGDNAAYYPSFPYGLANDPEIDVSFPGNKKQQKIYRLSGIVEAKVAISNGFIGEAPKEAVEVYVFLDGVFVSEGPTEEMPASIFIDTTKYANDFHIFTFNIRTSDDRAASCSVNVEIIND